MEMTWKWSQEDLKKLAIEVAAINKESNLKREVIIPTDQEIQYTVREISKMSKQSQPTITRHIREGLLTASKVGKNWKITQENYLKYINNDNTRD